MIQIQNSVPFSAQFSFGSSGLYAVSLSYRQGEWCYRGSYSPEQRKEIEEWIACYLRGEHRYCSTHHLELSSFTRQVLEHIARIPFARTVTYAELAQMMGMPHKVRAVAQACGRNPLPLLIPCHRVVAKQGIGGFSQPDGIGLKKALLSFEQSI